MTKVAVDEASCHDWRTVCCGRAAAWSVRSVDAFLAMSPWSSNSEPAQPRQSRTDRVDGSPGDAARRARAAPGDGTDGSASQGNPFQGSVPTGSATATPLTLSLRDAIARGLATNLGVLESAEGVRKLSRSVAEQPEPTAAREGRNCPERPSRSVPRVIGLHPRGLPGITFPGDRALQLRGCPRLRVAELFNWSDISSASICGRIAPGVGALLKAARELVVQAAANAYLVAIADRRWWTRRAPRWRRHGAAPRTPIRTAPVLSPRSTCCALGCELQTEQQRLIAAENQLADRQAEARTCDRPSQRTGVHPGRRCRYSELGDLTVDQALARAPGFPRGLPERTSAGARRGAREAGGGGRELPSATVDVNYGAIGATPGDSHGTVAVVGAVSIPTVPGHHRAGARAAGRRCAHTGAPGARRT